MPYRDVFCPTDVRHREKRILPPLHDNILDSEQQKRKKKKRTNPITHYFPPIKITRLDHPVKEDLPLLDRYENRSFGSANILDPPV
jgi:hypothetical protein